MIYAVIADGRCVNIIEADAAFAAQIGAVELPTGYGIGDGFDGTTWSKAEPVAENHPVDHMTELEGRVADLVTELTAVQAELTALKGA